MTSRINRHCALALLLLTTVPFSASAQTLNNPDFELPGTEGTVPDGWTVEKGILVLDKVKKYSGSFAGKLDGGEGTASAYQDIPVTPGTPYRLTGFWRNGDRTAPFDLVVAEVHWLSAPGGKDMGQAAIADSGPVVGDWTPFQLTAGIPLTGAGGARIILRSKFGVAAFDALNWGPVGEAASTPGSVAAAQGSGPAAVPSPEPASSIPPLTQVLSAPPGKAGNSGATGTPGTETAQLPDLSRMNQPRPASSAQPSSTAVASQLKWADDLRAARSTAATEKKRIFVFFAGSDALTRQLESSLFSNPEVVAAMNGFIPVKLEMEKNRNLAHALQVNQPGVVTIYDSRGEFLARVDNPTADKLIEQLKKLAGR